MNCTLTKKIYKIKTLVMHKYEDKDKNMTMLQEMTEKSHAIKLDLCYATNKNITSRPIYQHARCYAHPKAVCALEHAVELADSIKMKFKIFDAFRPIEAQKILWDAVPNPEFVSPPETGKIPHCRGIAFDLTLMDAHDQELDMGTTFDAFTPESHHGCINITVEAQKNRLTLLGIMRLAGFDHHPKEWWHYQLPHYQQYNPLDDQVAKTFLMQS